MELSFDPEQEGQSWDLKQPLRHLASSWLGLGGAPACSYWGGSKVCLGLQGCGAAGVVSWERQPLAWVLGVKGRLLMLLCEPWLCRAVLKRATPCVPKPALSHHCPLHLLLQRWGRPGPGSVRQGQRKHESCELGSGCRGQSSGHQQGWQAAWVCGQLAQGSATCPGALCERAWSPR